MSLITTVIGSYTVPDWYPVLQEAVVKGTLSKEAFQDAKVAAVQSAICDQVNAGIDVISDGELFRRSDNCYGPPNAMINYFADKITGFSGEHRAKSGLTPIAPEASFPSPIVTGPLKPTSLGLLDELSILRANTDKQVKIAMTGPHMFACISWDEHYKNTEALAKDMAKVINREFTALDNAGCDFIQLDEPVIWFAAQDQKWAIEAINTCFSGVKRAKKALHVCQGNYNQDPNARKGLRIFPAEFKSIIPVLEQCDVDIILMTFTSLGEDPVLLKEFPKDRILGLGVIDVQNHEVESPEKIAKLIEKISKSIDIDRLWLSPDCGLNHLPREIAFRKLQALKEGAKIFGMQLAATK
ncbi:MAG: cobalamin-independent methionine synthase II family protein [Candidatus Obscuribacterales bacterium]|nr:cobalamin-independent methionine synthase II family protein [Candidatus Obscuribacterales bacterium]